MNILAWNSLNSHYFTFEGEGSLRFDPVNIILLSDSINCVVDSTDLNSEIL